MLRRQRGPTRQQPTAQCRYCRGRHQGPGHNAGCMLQQQQLQTGGWQSSTQCRGREQGSRRISGRMLQQQQLQTRGPAGQQPPTQYGFCRGRQQGSKRISGRMLQQQQLQTGGWQSSTQCSGREQGSRRRSGRMPGTWGAAGVCAGHGHPICRGHAQVGSSLA